MCLAKFKNPNPCGDKFHCGLFNEQNTDSSQGTWQPWEQGKPLVRKPLTSHGKLSVSVRLIQKQVQESIRYSCFINDAHCDEPQVWPVTIEDPGCHAP